MSERDRHQARALIAEPQPTMCSILATQLPDLDAGHVTSAQRSRDACPALERRPFEIVLCSRQFEGMPDEGQDLLDELQRETQPRHSTVFIVRCTSIKHPQRVKAGESALVAQPLEARTVFEKWAQPSSAPWAMLEVSRTQPTLGRLHAGQRQLDHAPSAQGRAVEITTSCQLRSRHAEGAKPPFDETQGLRAHRGHAAKHTAGIQRPGRSTGDLLLEVRAPETADAGA